KSARLTILPAVSGSSNGAAGVPSSSIVDGVAAIRVLVKQTGNQWGKRSNLPLREPIKVALCIALRTTQAGRAGFGSDMTGVKKGPPIPLWNLRTFASRDGGCGRHGNRLNT